MIPNSCLSWFGCGQQPPPSPSKAASCDPLHDCSGNGKCAEDGTCVCDPRWSGAKCTYNRCADISVCEDCVTIKDKTGGRWVGRWMDLMVAVLIAIGGTDYRDIHALLPSLFVCRGLCHTHTSVIRLLLVGRRV